MPSSLRTFPDPDQCSTDSQLHIPKTKGKESEKRISTVNGVDAGVPHTVLHTEYLQSASRRTYSVEYVHAAPIVPLSTLGRDTESVTPSDASCFLLPASCPLRGWKSIILLSVSVPFRLLFSASSGILSATLVRETVISGTAVRPTSWMGSSRDSRDRFFFFFFFMPGPKDHEALELAPGAVGSL